MAPVNGYSPDVTLQVDGFGMSIGPVSVGLPAARTADAVLLRYIDLVKLADGETGRRDLDAAGDDVVVLAEATRLDVETVRRRLARLAS